MDLLVEFIRTAIKFVLMLGVCTGGALAGIALRKRKNRNANQES